MKHEFTSHKELLKITNSVELCHMDFGRTIGNNKTLRITIDNHDCVAAACVDRLVSYIDCVVAEILQPEDRYEDVDMTNVRGQADIDAAQQAICEESERRIDAGLHYIRSNDVDLPAHFHRHFFCTTDRFDFYVDDAHFDLNMKDGIEVEDLTGVRIWKQQRERVLNAKVLRVDYHYEDEMEDIEPNDEYGALRMMDDLLIDGRMGDRVKLVLHVEWPWFFEDDDDDESLLRTQHHGLLMRGMHRGKYVAGEVPFEQNDALIRTIGGWRMSYKPFVLEEEEGLLLKMDMHVDQEILDRAKALEKKVRRRFDCATAEFPPRFEPGRMEDIDSAEQTRLADQQIFAETDYRPYFTAEVQKRILATYPKLSAMYVQHADPSYDPDLVEKVRFNTCVSLIQAYGEPADLAELVRQVPNIYKKVLGELPGIETGDLYRFASEGYILQIRSVFLGDFEDVRDMCSTLDEIHALTENAEGATPIPPQNVRNLEDFEQILYMDEWSLGDFFTKFIHDQNAAQAEALVGDTILTMREFKERLFNGSLYFAQKNELNDDVFYFEVADPKAIWARLRFRRVDGHYIAEIACAD